LVSLMTFPRYSYQVLSSTMPLLAITLHLSNGLNLGQRFSNCGACLPAGGGGIFVWGTEYEYVPCFGRYFGWLKYEACFLFYNLNFIKVYTVNLENYVSHQLNLV
jgi:hypothetical protein